MKPEWLQRIIEREGKATPGPWIACSDYSQDARGWGVKVDPVNASAETLKHWRDFIVCEQPPDVNTCFWGYTNNFQFIAHARTDIPTLLSALNKAYELAEFYETSHDYGGKAREFSSFNPMEVINE